MKNMKIIKLTKPCYMIKNKYGVLPPIKIFNNWYRGYYDTKASAERALKLIEQRAIEGWEDAIELYQTKLEIIEVTGVICNERKN